MPAVLVRNLSTETHLALKRRARAHGGSTEAEIRQILDKAVRDESGVGLGTRLHELGKKYGGWDLEIERDQRPSEPVTLE